MGYSKYTVNRSIYLGYLGFLCGFSFRFRKVTFTSEKWPYHVSEQNVDPCTPVRELDGVEQDVLHGEEMCRVQCLKNDVRHEARV